MTAPRKPLVSVAIPTYRGAKTIGTAIESVLDQTLADFELIVIDDASSDKTLQIISTYTDSRIRFYQNTHNLGHAANWNRCLNLASGRYFKLLPHDDVLRKDCLEKQVAILEKDVAQELSLVFCARTIINSRNHGIMVRRWSRVARGQLSSAAIVRRCMRYGTNLIGEPGAVMFRRSLVSTVGYFDATNPYVIDLDYWFRLLAHGDAFYDPDTLVAFRVTRQSWSYTIRRQQSSDFTQMIRRLSLRNLIHPTLFDVLSAAVATKLNSLLRYIIYKFIEK